MLRTERAAIALALAAAATRLLSLWRFHPLNWDEIEYFRDADWIRQGLVPYRDFWEHHTPLQWFLFAPVTALVPAGGAAAIIAMRFAQLPLWIITFALLFALMRRSGIGRAAGWAALALLFCSSFFMLPAVEYRVDVLGNALVIAALVAFMADRGFLAGVALALAGFANVRLGPVIVIIAVIAVLRWRDRRALRLIAGGALAVVASASYFVATRSAAVAFRSVWTDNYLADRAAAPVPGLFAHRLLTPFGYRLLDHSFAASSIDVATILLFVLGLIGLVRAIGWRRGYLVLSAVVLLANLAFVAVMKYIFNYHFELTMLLLVPLAAFALDSLRGRVWGAAMAMLVVVVLINAAVVIFRAKEADLAYQDRIMAEVERRTPRGSRVFDGAGWALRRQPAYRYWFLREIVRTLERTGRLAPYRALDMAANPPAAVISDYGARLWLATHPDLNRFVVTHYLPRLRDLWLPGMSAVLPPHGAAQWVVPADGEYRVYASTALASHPWFAGNPVVSGSYARRDVLLPLEFVRNDARLVWSARSPMLRRGMILRVTSLEPADVGIFIVPKGDARLFEQPAPGVDLDGAAPPQWHVPAWR